MPTYILKYKQPYECDVVGCSRTRIRDRKICFVNKEKHFRALNDKDAWRKVNKFLEGGSLDGDCGTYKRKFVCLIRIELEGKLICPIWNK